MLFISELLYFLLAISWGRKNARVRKRAAWFPHAWTWQGWRRRGRGVRVRVVRKLLKGDFSTQKIKADRVIDLLRPDDLSIWPCNCATRLRPVRCPKLFRKERFLAIHAVRLPLGVWWQRRSGWPAPRVVTSSNRGHSRQHNGRGSGRRGVANWLPSLTKIPQYFSQVSFSIVGYI